MIAAIELVNDHIANCSAILFLRRRGVNIVNVIIIYGDVSCIPATQRLNHFKYDDIRNHCEIA